MQLYHLLRTTLIAFLLCLTFSGLKAQDTTTTPREKTTKIFPIPIAFYTPETGLGLGAGITSVIKTPNGSYTPRQSQITLGFAYTTLKQTLLYLPFSVYVFDQKMYLTGELGYFDYTFRYFGFTNGVEPDSIEFYRANFPRVRLNANYQVRDGLFLGPRLVYDQFEFTNFAAEGRLAPRDVAGSEDHIVATVGLGAILDKRNNVLFPTNGHFVDAAVEQSVNPDYMYTTLTLDATLYLPWSEQGTFAINGYTQSLLGDAPFTAYPKLGGTKKLRGFFEGSILQRHVTALQFEARSMLFWRIGMAAFVGFGNGTQDYENWALRNTQIAGGAGLRVRLTDKLNARVDYSVGLNNRSGFYITFGEAF